MIIRDATLADVDGLAHVHVESWRATYIGIMPDEAIAARPLEVRKRQWQRNLSNDDSQTVNLVAEKNNQIIGFASGGKPQSDEDSFDCELYAIYLLQEAQGKGIGRRLMTAVAENLFKAGYKTMILTVLKGNDRSRGFYEAMSGEFIGEGSYTITSDITLATAKYGWQDIRTLLEES